MPSVTCFDKIFFGRRFQCIVGLLFFADGAVRIGTEIFSAGTAGAMCRINNHIICQGNYFCLQAVIHHTRQIIPW